MDGSQQGDNVRMDGDGQNDPVGGKTWGARWCQNLLSMYLDLQLGY